MQFANIQSIMTYVQKVAGLIRLWLVRKLSALIASGASFYKEVQDLSLIHSVCSRCFLVARRLRRVLSGRFYNQLSDWFLAFGNFTIAVFKAQLLDVCLARWESYLRVSIFMYYL